MFLKRKLLLHKGVFFACFGLLMLLAPVHLFAQKPDTSKSASLPPVIAKSNDSLLRSSEPKYVGPLQFPITDNRGDFLSSGSRSTYDFRMPSNIKDSIAYDPATNTYTVYEKIGNRYYRTPVTYTAEEYWKLRGRQAEIAYWQKRANKQFQPACPSVSNILQQYK